MLREFINNTLSLCYGRAIWLIDTPAIRLTEIKEYEYPRQFRTPSIQQISSTQKGHSFSAPKIPQFHTKNSSVQHAPQFHIKNPSVQHREPRVNRGYTVLNWGVFDIELRDSWCRTERFCLLKRCGSCVELMCWTEGYSWKQILTPWLRGCWNFK